MASFSIHDHLPFSLRETAFEHLGELRRGKVRDTYHRDDQIILITTDRISAFDHILNQTIPLKGQVLNQLAAFFFENTADVMDNHVLEVPDPNVTVGKRCEPIPIEFVVRGYLAGHAWRVYKSGRRSICGIELPEGLEESSRLPEPILTPATKAESGHDEDITREEAIERGLIGAETFDFLRERALALFRRGTEMARERGLLLVDTKYEFGRAGDGSLLLIDEVHTPDSSRYYFAENYEERLESGLPQRQLSKEFVREWLMDEGFMGKAGQEIPDMTDEFRVNVAERYLLLYERLTGRTFEPPPLQDPIERIERALEQALA